MHCIRISDDGHNLKYVGLVSFVELVTALAEEIASSMVGREVAADEVRTFFQTNEKWLDVERCLHKYSAACLALLFLGVLMVHYWIGWLFGGIIVVEVLLLSCICGELVSARPERCTCKKRRRSGRRKKRRRSAPQCCIVIGAGPGGVTSARGSQALTVPLLAQTSREKEKKEEIATAGVQGSSHSCVGADPARADAPEYLLIVPKGNHVEAKPMIPTRAEPEKQWINLEDSVLGTQCYFMKHRHIRVDTFVVSCNPGRFSHIFMVSINPFAEDHFMQWLHEVYKTACPANMLEDSAIVLLLPSIEVLEATLESVSCATASRATAAFGYLLHVCDGKFYRHMTIVTTYSDEGILRSARAAKWLKMNFPCWSPEVRDLCPRRSVAV